MRLGVPWIMCDDARTMPEVTQAIDRAVAANPTYERAINPFYNHDARGIVYLRRRL